MTKPQTIDAIYAWIATEPDGGEGIPAVKMGDTWMPLIGADMDRIKSLRPHAEHAKIISGRPVRLVRFSRRNEMEEL